MLRNIFSKLPGIKAKVECTVSSSCRAARSVSPESRYIKEKSLRKPSEECKEVRKRAYSFPSLSPRACHLLERGRHNSVYSQYKNLSYRGHRDDDTISTRTTRSTKQQEKSGQDGTSCFETYDIRQYELEAARPKAVNTEFAEMLEQQMREKHVFFPSLQPNNLRPFGSRDNVVYSHITLKPTASFKVGSNNFFDQDAEDREDGGKVAGKSNVSSKPHTRKFSTASKTKMVEDIFQTQLSQAGRELQQEAETSTSKVLKAPMTEDFQAFKSNKINFDDGLSLKTSPIGKCVENNMISRFPSYSDFVKKSNVSCKKFAIVYPESKQTECVPIPPVGEVQKDQKQLLVVNQEPQAKRNLSKSVKISRLPSNTQVRHGCNACDTYKDQKRREKEEREGKKREKRPPSERRPLEPAPCDENKCGRKSKLSAKSTPFLSNIPNNKVQEQLSATEIQNTSTQGLRSKALLNLDKELVSARNLSTKNSTSCFCKAYYDQKQREKAEKMGKKPPSRYVNPYRIQRALEPALCDNEDTRVPRKICLPSAVRLRPPECTPRPFYDCKKPPPCQIRADDCVKPKIKPLPKLLDGNCRCVEPYIPDKAPKLKRLPMKLCDPPRICPVEPCFFQSRADDGLKVKQKFLKPYKPRDCPCVEPPRMIDVPLKRLIPNCPPEVCRPIRVCPCPPCDETQRADYCLKVKPKRLPFLVPKNCPCVPDPPMKNVKMKRLNLKVKEPCRVCPEPCICHVDCPRADLGLKVLPKKLPPIVPGDCPCIPEPMKDVPLKRLKCEDEPPECVYSIPDPCKEFPRADWGCWEYPQVEWVEVDEKCINIVDPCNPKQPKVDPCKKLGAGSKKGNRHMSSKRGYGTDSSSSLHLFYKLKYKSLKNDQGKDEVKSVSYDEPLEVKFMDEETKPIKITQRSASFDGLMSKKKAIEKKIASTVDLIKRLNNPERDADNPYIFTVPKSEKLTVDSIVNKISATSNALNQSKSEPKLGKLCSHVKLQQRMLSTSNILKNQKDCDKKKSNPCVPKKSKTCAPKKKICKKTCPRFPKEKCKVRKQCDDTCPLPDEDSKFCMKQRTPVCCQKTESPYTSFSDVMEKEIAPFTKTSQWNCDRKEYGYHPHPKKFSEPLQTVKDKDKDKKKYSTDAALKSSTTCDLISQLPLESDIIVDEKNTYKNLGKEIFQIYKAKQEDGIVKEKTLDTTPNLAYKPIHKRYSELVRQKSLIPGNQIEEASHKTSGISAMQFHSNPQSKKGILTRNFIGQHPKEKRHYSIISSGPPMFLPLRHSSNTKHPCYIKDPPKKKPCVKETCKKFRLPNCPPAAPKRICHPYQDIHRPQCKKAQAPFPAFSDCLNEELEEVLSECPYEREKLSRLQPQKMTAVEKPDVPAPPPPYQGLIDPMKEEDCVRQKLCMKKEGLSQTCRNFGEFVKPLRSKDFFKYVDPDCAKLEEMKKRRKGLDSRMYKIPRERKFSTASIRNVPSFVPVKRNYSSLSGLFDLKNLFGCFGSSHQSIQNKKNESKKRIYIRNYHALCKNPDMNYLEDIDKKIKEASQNHFAEFDENTCKLLKLRNVQWRVTNFKKWDNLNKQCNVSKTVKRFYKSSSHKYKHYTRKECFSTNAKSAKCENTETTTHERRLSTNVSLLKPNDSNSCKIKVNKPKTKIKCGRSESRRKKPCIRYSLQGCAPVTKRHHNCNDPRPNVPCKKKLSPYQSFSDCHKHENPAIISECPYVREKIRNLQPKYTVSPEIESASNYPSQPTVDPDMEIEYVRCKLGMENEGITQTCEDFGKPIKYLRCKDINKYTDPDCKLIEDKKNYEECCRKAEEQRKKLKRQGKMALLKKKLQDAAACPDQQNVCMYGNKIPEDDCDELGSVQTEDKEEKTTCPQEPETLWQKIVNYFKARPNCPTPDEWKKKALREKAEKAAAAAGMCLIDPKDLKKYKETDSCDESAGTNESDASSCDERKMTRKGSSDKGSLGMSKRQYSTLVLKRCYSKNLNQKNIDDINRILEEEEMKHRTRSDRGSADESDLDILLNGKNQMLARFDEDFEGVAIEECSREEDEYELSFFHNVMPSRENILENVLQIYTDDSNRYQEAKMQAAFQEVASKLEQFKRVPSFEEIENLKTQSLVNELNKLLNKEKGDSNKE